MKTKIVIISETIMDGVGKHIVDVISRLDYEKIDLHVIHSRDRLDYRFFKLKEDKADVVQFYEVPEMIREIHPKKDLESYLKVYALLKKIRPDIVHCHSSKAGVVGRLAARILNVESIYYTPHAYAIQNRTLSKSKYVLFVLIERFLARFATTLTLNVSEGERQFALNHRIGNEASLKVLYNCVESIWDQDQSKNVEAIGAIKLKYDIPEDDLIVGTVARLYTQKNPEEYIKIAFNICNATEHVTFLWIGEGEFLEDMKQKVKTAQLEDRILFLGHQTEIEVFYLLFDVYLTTALYEGLPYTLIEAMSSKTPIVASNVTGNNELVLPEETGYLYELGDIEEATQKLKHLIEQSELRDQMREAAYHFYKAHFTIQEMMKAYSELYL
ncbi:glycosyltransferase family 4 protein [Fusibacter ferrireducens]|uniref:Glycosyltransferase family 4 protein n=1 Tax=Fusibacter ferrireducens TaxID=2785058 RepID=A0ABR9ZXM9_9FIRM|nr:glycosyltransferase family 4 protein [Fusibacter ferrireducens]MBF4695121.1 glycosyltransferase family 4 protein [Fusibacter ferrireducens]